MKRFITLLLVSLPILIFSQAPILDPSFGQMGKVFHDFSEGEAEVIDAVIQQDGKSILLVKIDPVIWRGLADQLHNHIWIDQYSILRVDNKGDMDSTFGTLGRYKFPQSSFPFEFSKIIIDSLDRLYIGGRLLSKNLGGTPKKWSRFVLRLDRNGQLDVSFGQNGFFYFNQHSLPDFHIETFVLTPQNTLVIGGSILHDPNYYLMQLSLTGQFDPTFGNLGLVTYSNSQFGPTKDFQIQHDSLLLIARLRISTIYLERFFLDGKVDSLFGNKAIPVMTGFPNKTRVELFVLPDQSFLVAGQKDALRLWKYHANGLIDSSFATHGLAEMGDPSHMLELKGLEVDSLGKIYLLGSSDVHPVFSLFRVNPDGTRDLSFGINGLKEYQKGGMEDSYPQYLGLQDHKITMLGSCYPEICLFRTDSLGMLDSTFHNDGEASVRLPGSGSVFQKMKVDSAGNMWVIGYYAENIRHGHLQIGEWPGYIKKPFFVKFGPLGDTHSIDFETFGLGKQELAWGDIEIGSDHGIFISGTEHDSTDTQDSRPFIIKLKPNGEPDSSFSLDGIEIVRVTPSSFTITKGQQLVVQEDNKPILSFKGDLRATGFIRYTQIGHLDTSLNKIGYVREKTPIYHQGKSLGLNILNKNEIYHLYSLAGNELLLNTYSLNGSSTSGIFIWNENLSINGAALLLRNNKSLIAFAHTFKFNVYQYLNNGKRDSSFGFDGFESVSFTKGRQINSFSWDRKGWLSIAGGAYMPNGDLVLVGGHHDDDRNFSVVITRLDSNGHRKLAFGQDGKFYLEMGNKPGSVQDMHLYDNGDLLVCGITGSEAFLFRFLQDLVLPIQSELLPSSPERPLIYPNPLSQQANLKLTLSRSQEVDIQLYDLRGRFYKNLYTGYHAAGEQTCSLNFPTEIASGFYLVKVSTEEGESFIRVQVR